VLVDGVRRAEENDETILGAQYTKYGMVQRELRFFRACKKEIFFQYFRMT